MLNNTGFGACYAAIMSFFRKGLAYFRNTMPNDIKES